MASVNKLRTLDTDGPAGLNSRTINAFGTGYCSEILIAQTWNEELAAKAGEGISREFTDFHIVGWYAPSMNLHRSAFGGRVPECGRDPGQVFSHVDDRWKSLF